MSGARVTAARSAGGWQPDRRTRCRSGTAARARAGSRTGVVPLPNNTGARAISSSSTTPRFRYCWTTSAPPAMRMSRRPADFPGELQRALRPVVDEMEGRPAGARPGVASLVGQHVHRGVKRGLLRPGALALVEHPLAHDVGADALRRAANQIVDRAGFSPGPDMQFLAEVLLLEEPRHQRAPLGTPVLVAGVPMVHGHAFRRHVAIEAQCRC